MSTKHGLPVRADDVLAAYRRLPPDEQEVFAARLLQEGPLPAPLAPWWLTLAQAAHLLARDKSQVTRAVKAGHLTSNGQIGRAMRVRLDTVLARVWTRKVRVKVRIREVVKPVPAPPPPSAPEPRRRRPRREPESQQPSLFDPR